MKKLTRGEFRLKRLLRVYFWLYGLSGLYFLFAHDLMLQSLNRLSARITPALPPYSLPEGGFWLTLAFSMMLMLAYLSRLAAEDPQGRRVLVKVIILSKGVSSLLYLYFFLAFKPLAYLIGFLTDFPLFVLTAVYYFLAAEKFFMLSEREKKIFIMIGGALIPRGGAFALGVDDIPDKVLSRVENLLAQYDLTARFTVKLVLNELYFFPPIMSRRLATLSGLGPEERQEYLKRWDESRRMLDRMALLMIKSLLYLAFYGIPEVEREIGYVRPTGTLQDGLSV